MLLAVVLLAAAGWAAWHWRGQLLGWESAVERLGAEKEKLRQTPPRELLGSLRERVAGIQERWEEWNESGEIREKLDQLRAELVRRRDAAGETARRQWEELIAKSETLAEKAKEKTSRAPLELEELKTLVRKLEGQVLGEDRPSTAPLEADSPPEATPNAP